ncbi:MAG: protein DpdF [Polyangiaceae bacterium]
MSDFQLISSLLATWPERPVRVTEVGPNIGSRLWHALRDLRAPDRSEPGPLDLAGLISHVLRRESLLNNDRELRLRVPRGPTWPDADLWKKCMCEVALTGPNHYLLRAGTWRPNWLTCSGVSDPLVPALVEESRRNVECLPADPAIQEVLGYRYYLGLGQRMAVRSALLLRPGGCLLAVLPTGGGKSLALLAPALLQGNSDGLTLVIVPTVALALDQERRAKAIFSSRPGHSPVGRLAYHSALPQEVKRAIVQRIREGTQSIIFTSPEGAMLSLRPALLHAAAAGRLNTLVVDEAHLVAQWGTEFRPEFQALSGLRRTLMAACGKHPALRTVLLTATLTQEAWSTLNTLFGDGDLEVCASVNLRVEPDFYVAAASNEEQRKDRVVELAHVLPRPFILYTTTREDCEEWTSRLRKLGLRRVGSMHGGTLALERETVLQRWVNRELDVMVATSAFGLGMDQSDVRAVVHACVPETVDRFYQEAGRAGRDGRACLSFLVHTPADVGIAKRLNSDRVISVDKGLDRWDAMHHSAEPIGDDGALLVRLDTQTKRVTQDSAANVAWNLRTLVLMARSGLLTLEAHAPPQLNRDDGETEESFNEKRERAFQEYAITTRVRPAPVDHLSKNRWLQNVERHRQASLRADKQANERVSSLLSGEVPFAVVFQDTYTVAEAGIQVAPSILNCPASRRLGLSRQAGIAPSPLAPHALVSELGHCLKRAIGAHTRILVALPRIDPISGEARRMQRRIIRLMERLVADGLREISAPSEWLDSRDYRRLYLRAQPQIVLHSPPERQATPFEEALAVPRLSLLWPRASGQRLQEVLLVQRPVHLIFLPEDVPDLERPDRGFLDTRAHFTLEHFERRLD